MVGHPPPAAVGLRRFGAAAAAVTLAVFLLSTGCARTTAGSARPETDWKLLDLQGRVERIESTTWYPDPISVTGELVVGGRSTSWFDTEGYLAEQRGFDTDGKPRGSVQYSRPLAAAGGSTSERTARWYGADGELQSRTVTSYDSRGRRIEETSLDPDGKRTGGYRYEYDAGGRLVRRTMEALYEDDDRRAMETRYAYDGKGHLVEERFVEADLGGLALRIEHRWRDDRRVVSADYQSGTFLLYLTFYEYDAAGNVVREVSYQLPEDGSADRYAGTTSETDLPVSLRSSMTTNEYRYAAEKP